MEEKRKGKRKRKRKRRDQTKQKPYYYVLKYSKGVVEFGFSTIFSIYTPSKITAESFVLLFFFSLPEIGKNK